MRIFNQKAACKKAYGKNNQEKESNKNEYVPFHKICPPRFGIPFIVAVSPLAPFAFTRLLHV